jgi:hypothetical protein
LIRRRLRSSTVALAILAMAASLPGRAEEGSPARPTVLFAADYPVEIAILEHAARFHWLDSLAGLELPGSSAGKTVDAHREAYIRLLGRPNDADRDWIRRFADVRVRFAERRMVEYRERGEADFSALLVAFLSTPDEATALDRAADLVGEAGARTLAGALDHFRERYDRFWRDGRWLDAFLDSVRGTRAERRLGRMLARMAELYGVEVPFEPGPRIVLAPTPSGYGTHATAQGRHLLIEVRPLDRIDDAASVIAHENAHLLFTRMTERDRTDFERPFLEAGARGTRAWATLLEALPTALGQGVFDRRFRRLAWSVEAPWYHRPDVDAYAKAIFPVVAGAFASGARLDQDLGRALLDAWPGETAPEERAPDDAGRPAATRRGP